MEAGKATTKRQYMTLKGKKAGNIDVDPIETFKEYIKEKRHGYVEDAPEGDNKVVYIPKKRKVGRPKKGEEVEYEPKYILMQNGQPRIKRIGPVKRFENDLERAKYHQDIKGRRRDMERFVEIYHRLMNHNNEDIREEFMEVMTNVVEEFNKLNLSIEDDSVATEDETDE
jgi:hypothetical protein